MSGGGGGGLFVKAGHGAGEGIVPQTRSRGSKNQPPGRRVKKKGERYGKIEKRES